MEAWALEKSSSSTPRTVPDLLFELLSTPLEAERGQTAFVSVLRNVTDLGRATREIEDNYKRLRAAEALARAERRRIEQVIHSVVDPIIVSNAAGKILMTNRPAELLFTPRITTPRRFAVRMPMWRGSRRLSGC